MKAGISVSYNGDHRKGDGQQLDPVDHARMLHATVTRYRRLLPDWPIFVCACGFDGLTSYTREQDENEKRLLWETWQIARFVTIPENPGYSEGATWSIRQGIEAAYHSDCAFLVHTCEDTVPELWLPAKLIQELADYSVDYVGERWRENELSTQFFACRVRSFMGFNGKGDGSLVEAYMWTYIKANRLEHLIYPDRKYFHTHTPKDFFAAMEKAG